MRQTNYQTGWSKHAWIEVKKISRFADVNSFKCNVSNQELEAEFLVLCRTNFKHRGNETDETFFYNRKFTPPQFLSVWEKWDKLRTSKIEKIKSIADKYNLDVSVKLREI